MADNDRVYMVLSEDENGDSHLFSTDDLDRAEAMLQVMLIRFGNARASWMEAGERARRHTQGNADAPAPNPRGPYKRVRRLI